MTLLEALRANTNHLHHEAERAMNIMAPQMSVADYAQKLKALRSLYGALQTSLGEAVARQTERLDRDLRALDVKIIPECPEPNELGGRSRDQLFREGMMYVIEGSALGGQIVSQHIREKLGITPENGGAFFFGDGAKVGENWRATLSRLAHHNSQPHHWDSVIQGAEATFRLFLDKFRTTF